MMQHIINALFLVGALAYLGCFAYVVAHFVAKFW